MAHLQRSKEKLLSQEEAWDILNPMADRIVKSVQEGLNHFSEGLSGPLRQRLRPRSFSSSLNDCIVYEASQIFAEVEGVQVFEECESTWFLFSPRAVLRFKKVDESETPRNFPTRRQSKITYQQHEFSVCDSKPTVINIGYQPNKFFTEIKSVSLSCHDGSYVCWQLPLAGEISTFMFDQNLDVKPASAPSVIPTLKRKKAVNE